MDSTPATFASRAEHRAWLDALATLPLGVQVGSARFTFTPREAPRPAAMTLTLLDLGGPTTAWAVRTTRNAVAGAPVILWRRAAAAAHPLAAILVNNKVSNVGAPGGVDTASRLCDAAAAALGYPAGSVLPGSTGVIGWSLPAEPFAAAIPDAVGSRHRRSILPAAEGIMTTDLFPKVRRHDFPGGGSLVGIAKGAGMIEPNLATMLVYLLTDVALPRTVLDAALGAALDPSFHSISIDSDTSTSDTVVLASTGLAPAVPPAVFSAALNDLCTALAGDIVRNGEGVRHVIRVQVSGMPDDASARALGRAIVNAPLFKSAVAGNDPNVGRLLQAAGRHLGLAGLDDAAARLRVHFAGHLIYEHGTFSLNPAREAAIAAHLRHAELYQSRPDGDGNYRAPVDFPPHQRCVEVALDAGSGAGSATVLGADLTHEYVSENADYRS